MNDCMIVFKEIESSNHTLVQSSESRKIDRILNLMVAVEVPQELIEPRCEKTLKNDRLDFASSEGDQCPIEFGALIAQQVVNLKPEGGEFAKVTVRSPFDARIGRP